MAPAQAIAFGSMLGVIQVSARGLDFLGGGRWDGITTGLVAGTALPIAMLLLMLSEGATWAVAIFILLYGAGSGAMAVARATIPLVFYDQAEFAKAMSMIALPLNLASAISPPVLVSLLTQFGSRGALSLTLVFSCATVLILILLGRRRRKSPRLAQPGAYFPVALALRRVISSRCLRNASRIAPYLSDAVQSSSAAFNSPSCM